MDSIFFVKLLLSLIVGSTWVTISIIIAEKISGKVGGLIAGLPSTAAIGLLFIGFTQGVDAVIDATLIVPLSTGFYTYFYLSYILLAKKGFGVSMIGSLSVWFIFAFIASILQIQSFIFSIVIWLLLITTSIYFAVRYIKFNQNIEKIKAKRSPLWVKLLLSSSVIAFIVFISKVAGPTWGGIFSTFPALATSTFLITVRSGGVEFTRLIAKNILISTTTTIGLYVILVRIFYPDLGLILGTIVSYIVLLLISVPLYFFVFERLKKN